MNHQPKHGGWIEFLAGIMGGFGKTQLIFGVILFQIGSVSVGHPFDTIKVRLQTSKLNIHSPFTNYFTELYKMNLHQDGIVSLKLSFEKVSLDFTKEFHHLYQLFQSQRVYYLGSMVK